MIVPIFPLPNAVLFPRTLLPLHIFEERYKEMVREALEGDGRIVVALLRERPSARQPEEPPIHDIACLGRIHKFEKLDDGKYNILLLGIQRVRLVREVRRVPYRLAEVEELEDTTPDEQSPDILNRRNHMAALFARYRELIDPKVREKVPQLDFETLVNMVALTLNFPGNIKQYLLETGDVATRSDILMPVLQHEVEALVLVRRFEHIKPEDPSRN
jgi:uncharacterized protein